jgi:hypothetical protein
MDLEGFWSEAARRGLCMEAALQLPLRAGPGAAPGQLDRGGGADAVATTRKALEAVHSSLGACSWGLEVTWLFEKLQRRGGLLDVSVSVWLTRLTSATKKMHVAAAALAALGSRAMHAVLGRCRQHRITQFDFKCKKLARLVEPIMSYACQVWGPYVFVSKVASGDLYSAWSDAEKVHISYVHTMAGVGDFCIEVLMRDF